MTEQCTAFAALRVYALYNSNFWIFAIVLLLGMGNPAFWLVSNFHTMFLRLVSCLSVCLVEFHRCTTCL